MKICKGRECICGVLPQAHAIRVDLRWQTPTQVMRAVFKKLTGPAGWQDILLENPHPGPNWCELHRHYTLADWKRLEHWYPSRRASSMHQAQSDWASGRFCPLLLSRQTPICVSLDISHRRICKKRKKEQYSRSNNGVSRHIPEAVGGVLENVNARGHGELFVFTDQISVVGSHGADLTATYSAVIFCQKTSWYLRQKCFSGNIRETYELFPYSDQVGASTSQKPM